MTASDAATATGMPVAQSATDPYGCSDLLPAPPRRGLQLRSVDGSGRLSMLVVGDGGPATTRGFRVGDSERRLRRLYGSALRRARPGNELFVHDRRYMVRTRLNDATYALRFFVFRGRVMLIWAGRVETVSSFSECG